MNPTAAVLLEKGLAAQRAGQLDNAAAIYRQMLDRWPNQPDASYLLGLIAQKRGQHAEAIRLFRQAVAANPKLGRAHLQLGFSLVSLGHREDASAAFQAAITSQPDLAEAHHQLGNTLRALKRLPEALASLKEATRRSPSDAVFWLSRGIACMEAARMDEAAESFQRAVKLNSALPEAHEILGQALMALQRTDEARAQLTEALRLRPHYAEAHHDLGRLCVEEGLLTEAVGHYRNALKVKPAPDTQTNLLYILNYLPETRPEQHFEEHRRWSEWFERPLRGDWRPYANDPAVNRRLRIGYVSPDLRDHPVACFIEPILRAHHREHFEVICYANVRVPDAMTHRLQAHAGQWRNIYGVDPGQAAQQIRQDEIDILVDLAGHTTDNGLLIFARKPAPIQATWIGYPNTTGLEAMDYRITDSISDPPGQTEQWHTERLIRLPQTFSCYRAPEESPAVGPLAALGNGYVTFGSFNNFRKISDPTIALWGRLLGELPTARLLIKSQGLGNVAVARCLLDRFARAGVAPERIELLGAGFTKEQHMALYHRVDICLDPFPYNGTTTTCDALWMGVPVVTLTGRTHVARVGTSLVSHLGFPHWAAATPEEYVARCRELAGNLPALAHVRFNLREQMRASPLCDAARFIVHLESAYRSIWQHWSERQAR
jgi:protein O-GlcNAc transferase